MFLENTNAKYHTQANEMRFRILHLMNYDVTLTESENIKILTEQTKTQLTLPSSPSPTNWTLGPIQAGTINPTTSYTEYEPLISWDDVKKVGKNFGAGLSKFWSEYSQNSRLPLGVPALDPGPAIIRWFSTFDKHDWATFVEITTGILGLIPTPASPFLLGISLSAGLYDAKLYFDEDDPYMGGLMLAFAVLPAAEFIKAVPGSRKWLSNGSKYVMDLLKKSKLYSKLSKLNSAQKQVMKEAGDFINTVGKNSKQLAVAVSKKVVGETLTKIIVGGGKLLAGTALLLSKVAWAIGKPLIQVGGIYYTYDEIYLALYGSDEQKMKLRYNSRFQGLIRLLKQWTNVESAEEQMKEFLEINMPQIEENPEKLTQIDTTQPYSTEKISESQNKTIDNLEKVERSKIGPSLQEVLNKTINPDTEKPHVLKFGHRGPNVKKLQKILVELGLGDGLIGWSGKGKPDDGIFGENTFDTVLYIQGENGLKETGVVDSETLKLIYKLQKEMKQNDEK